MTHTKGHGRCPERYSGEVRCKYCPHDKTCPYDDHYRSGGVINKFDGKYRFLSNFYPSPIEFQPGITADTVEHFYSACKTDVLDERWEILAAPTPGKAKRRGRKATLHSDWEAEKVDVMWLALELKFEHGSELAARLLATGERELVEGNTWHDNFWGRCDCDSCWGLPSQNMLGKLLMERREQLRKDQ